MNDICNALNNCSRPKGHEGDHGHPVGDGIIVAPWPNTGEALPSVRCSLKCLQCESTTHMQSTDTGGYITCDECGEVYTFDAKGYTSYRMTIFPSGDPHAYSHDLKVEFMEYHRIKRRFMAEGLHLFHLINDRERDKRMRFIGIDAEEWWIQDAELQAAKRWWQFWKQSPSE